MRMKAKVRTSVDMRDERPLCIVLAFQEDERRLLYVVRSAQFPRKMYDESAWRMIAVGVEAPDEAMSQLCKHGHFETRIVA